MTQQHIFLELRRLADPVAAVQQARFFKTGPGEYGEGDQFLGIRVPVLRQLAKRFNVLPLSETFQLLQSPLHEARLLALLLLIRQFQTGDGPVRNKIYNGYLSRTRYINNWDLVDVSADKIVGDWLYHHLRERAVLTQLVRSRALWRRRIGMMATFYFIREGEFGPSLRLAGLLRDDPHDLIHKAVGWMLREIGKRDIDVERDFLDRHAHRMPRTMLRYALEKFPPRLRRYYMEK